MEVNKFMIYISSYVNIILILPYSKPLMRKGDFDRHYAFK